MFTHDAADQRTTLSLGMDAHLTPITRCWERPWVISATTRRSACSGSPGKAALPCRCGRWRAEARCDTRVAGDVYGKRLRAGSKWETAGKRPGARGNIEGRRRAYLTQQDFDLAAGGAPAAVQGTRWPAHGEKQFGQDAGTRGMQAALGTTASPEDFRSCACPAINPSAR